MNRLDETSTDRTVMTPAQAAEFLSISVKTLHRLRTQAENPLPARLIGPRSYRFLRDEVLDWMHREDARLRAAGEENG
ncbi:MAG: helix-turn-helix domain-containing protein [Chloroflexi bacterium]|nr:helix-turn-helix domain-containing protein [Chloroflexota bacterium]MBU1748793.1 helix-turn-helix domain-containing protein [Chloroflexota bacterium]